MTVDEKDRALKRADRIERLSEQLRIGSRRLVGLQQLTREISGELQELSQDLRHEAES